VVLTRKLTAVWPAATVAEAGTVALEELLVSVSSAPLGPAGPVSVTVAVEFAPPCTLGGLSVTEEIVAG
jgi:hypothetical protein